MKRSLWIPPEERRVPEPPHRPEGITNEGWLKLQEVLRKKTLMTASDWDIEVELQEPSPENLAIDRAAVERLFDPRLGEIPGDVGEVIFEAREPEGRYAHGVDLAKDVDWTIHKTYRVDSIPAEVVAWSRWGRLPWDEIGRKVDRRLRAYPGKSYHDGTGVGSVFGDHLQEASEPWIFTRGKDHRAMLSAYILVVEHGLVVSPLIEYELREHKLCTTGQVFGTDHLPDTVAAGALGVKAVLEEQGMDIDTFIDAYAAAMKAVTDEPADEFADPPHTREGGVQHEGGFGRSK